MNTKKCRGIKNARFWESLAAGKLSKMIDVIKKDPSLVLHFRNDYLNVYYHSGSVAKIKSEKSIEISENYFVSCDAENYTRNKNKQTASDIEKHEALLKRRNALKQLFYDGEFESYFDKMKKTMEKYWAYNSPGKKCEEKDEGDVQQEICIHNQYESKDSKYTIIDLEHEVSVEADFCYKGDSPFSKRKNGIIIKKKEKPRFDIVSVRKSTGQIFVWELKKGTGALEGLSGMHDHVDSYLHTIKESPEAENSFIEEMEHVLLQKQILGLIDKRVKIDTQKDVKFGFVYSYSDSAEDKKKQEEEKKAVESLRNQVQKGIQINEYPIIYLKPNSYTLSEK